MLDDVEQLVQRPDAADDEALRRDQRVGAVARAHRLQRPSTSGTTVGAPGQSRRKREQRAVDVREVDGEHEHRAGVPPILQPLPSRGERRERTGTAVGLRVRRVGR